MSTIWDRVNKELEERDVYKREIYAPYFIASWAIHVFNLENQRRKMYWEASQVPNMRGHLLFVAPPGWMKSFYMNTMGSGSHSIFKGSGIKIGAEQYMTEAGFVGTFTSNGGTTVPIEGAAKQYENGIMIIDEFSAITKALQMQHSNQLDNQLLTALDHGHVTKRLGAGKIEFDTRMTLWAGVQPARFDLTSGMGRRLQYLVFIPTKADNEYLMDTMHGNRNQAPNQKHLQGMWNDMLKFKDDMRKVQTVEFDDSVLNMYKSLGLYSFEASYFDRLVLGYQIAMYGPEKHMTISMKDNLLIELVSRQKKWRSQISMGIENIQLLKIIELAGDNPSRTQIVEDAAMYGWNAQQVFEMLKDMKMSGTISMSKKGVIEVLI